MYAAKIFMLDGKAGALSLLDCTCAGSSLRFSVSEPCREVALGLGLWKRDVVGLHGLVGETGVETGVRSLGTTVEK